MNAANGMIDHTPNPVSWMSPADMEEGYKGCSSSNLGQGFRSLGDFIGGCMVDGDPSNIGSVGHRRHFLCSGLETVSWGFVQAERDDHGYTSWDTFSAAHVANQDWRKNQSTDTCWPAQTQPLELWSQGAPWSVKIGGAVLDDLPITVTLTRESDGRVWTFAQDRQDDGQLYVSGVTYGGGPAIIFDPSNLIAKDGDSFTVTVEGLVNPLSYSVEFVDIPGLYASKPIDMFRMYNPSTGEHLYTSSAIERQTMIGNGWQYEGVMWKAPSYSSKPIYRLYNPNTDDHHYARTEEEYQNLCSAGWRGEWIAFYSDDSQGEPVYRLFNPNVTGAGTHHYTTSNGERSVNIAQGWQDEDIGWYGLR